MLAVGSQAVHLRAGSVEEDVDRSHREVAYPIVEPREVADLLMERARWSASRSSGPGGQRRDKVETRAELTLDLSALDGLEAGVAGRLADRLGLASRPLRIT